LLQSLEQGREQLESQQSDYTDEACTKGNRMGKRNQDVQGQLNVEMKRLESEREKMPAEKRRPELELKERMVSHNQKKRDEQ